MAQYKYAADFPADTKWTQLVGSAIAVTPDGRVFRLSGANVEELQAQSTRAKAGAPDDTNPPQAAA